MVSPPQTRLPTIQIHSELGLLSNMEDFGIDHNLLVGTIPITLVFPSAWFFFLSFNVSSNDDD